MEGIDISCVPWAPTYAQFPHRQHPAPPWYTVYSLWTYTDMSKTSRVRVYLRVPPLVCTCHGFRRLFLMTYTVILRQYSGKESICQCRRCKRCKFNLWLRKTPWRRTWQPTPVFLPGKFHRERGLEGLQSMGHKELDTTERLSIAHDDM